MVDPSALASAASSPRTRRSRNQALALAGSVAALGGLGYYLYTQWSGSSSSSSSSSSNQRRTASKRTGPPPTLSLSLPLSFTRNKENMMLLSKLLQTLSQEFVVTLIAPPPVPPETPKQNGRSSSGAPPVSIKSVSSSTSPMSSMKNDKRGIESVTELSQALEGVDGFDARRILEYSKEEGRLALARALACDAHCELMLQAYGARKATADSLFDNDDDDDSTEDGDVTPRAVSPARGDLPSLPASRRQVSRGTEEEQRQATLLEKYHAEVARIRKSSSLVVFLLLPVGEGPHLQTLLGPNGATASTNSASVSGLDLDMVLKPFCMPGQRDLSSRVPGVKIIDCRPGDSNMQRAGSESPSMRARNGIRTPSKDIPITDEFMHAAWNEAGVRLAKYSAGWS